MMPARACYTISDYLRFSCQGTPNAYLAWSLPADSGAGALL
jgi:hypothetical protein